LSAVRTAVLYCRVSTNLQSVEMQLRDLRRYAQQRGFKVGNEYIDEGVSGTRDSRPALNQLMDEARKRHFDCVLVWRFDRWARSTKHLIESLLEFRSLGIQFLSYQENLDTCSPLGEAMFVIISALAQLERDIIVQRVKSGLMSARARGKKLGRPKIRDDDKILLLRSQGLSIRRIAADLSLAKSTVQEALSGNPIAKRR